VPEQVIWQHARDVGQPAGFGQLIIAYAAAYVLWILLGGTRFQRVAWEA